MKQPNEVHVGNVGVDAGLIWVGDPCYVMGDDATCRVEEWSDFCERSFAKENETASQVSQPLGHMMGLAVSSGIGDGVYPVYVTYKDLGDWGNRVASVRVDFLLDDEEEAEDTLLRTSVNDNLREEEEE